MKTQILYSSEYGYSRKYAEETARLTGAPIAEGTRFDRDVETAVYFGAMYAGKVNGLKKAARSVPDGAKFVLAVVCLSDPADEQAAEYLRSCTNKQLPSKLDGRTDVFFLRGGVDFSALKRTHRFLLALVAKMAKSLPPEQLDFMTKTAAEAYGKTVDHTDFNALAPVMERIKN